MKKITFLFGAMLISMMTFAQSALYEIAPASMSAWSEDYSGRAFEITVNATTVDCSTATVVFAKTGAGTVVGEIGSWSSGNYVYAVAPETLATSLNLSDGDVFTLTVSNIIADNTPINVTGSYKFYQETPTYTSVSPVDGYVFAQGSETASQTVTFTLPIAMTCDSVMFMSGPRWFPETHYAPGPATATTSIATSILPTYWSADSDPLSMTVTLLGLKDNAGYSYPAFSVYYEIAGPETAQIVSITPDPSFYTYEDVATEEIEFEYDKVVSLGTNLLYNVDFYNSDWQKIDSITMPLSAVDIDIDGTISYVIAAAPSVPTSASNYSYVHLYISGVFYDGEEAIDQPSVWYNKSFPDYNLDNPMRAPKNQATGINDVVIKKSVHGVYNIKGNLIQNESSNLNLMKGLYIINGKKIIVR